MIENRKAPTLEQLQNEFQTNHKSWVSSCEIQTVDNRQKLVLITKEGYIFYITETGTEYKGKGEVVDTSALQREDVISLEIVGTITNGKIVKITDLSGKDYYELKYQIGSTDGEWIEIKSGDTVEVEYGKIIYAKLVYVSDSGKEHKLSIESEIPIIEMKDIDTSNIVRKTEIAFADLFEITWGSDGTGTVEYSVSGNLTFNNTSFNNTEIDNVSSLELGTYNVICKVTSPSNNTVTEEKQVKVTTLATTMVTNANNVSVDAKAIYSEYDLAYFSQLVNDGQNTINAKVINDLDLNNISHKVDGTTQNDLSFVSIGNSTSKFKGIFDGNEKIINNIYINSDSSAIGLFGYIESATIKNIVLESGEIKAKYDVGGIVGNSKGSNIENCINNNIIVSSTSYIEKSYKWGSQAESFKWSNIGGIAGYNYNTNIISCVNNARFEGLYSGIAGIVGFDDGDKERTITNCVNNADFSKDVNSDSILIGGVIGESFEYCIIKDCTNYGDINTNVGWVGGITGEITRGKVNNCINYGNITGRGLVGGISGMIQGSSTNIGEINSCTNEGKIEATGYWTESSYLGGKFLTYSASNTGGIVGKTDNGIVNLCKNKGTILTAGYDNIGGIVGYSCKNSTITKCSNYANIEESDVVFVGGIVGYTNKCKIEECFNVGKITAKSDVGGIAGGTTYTTVQNCFNTSSVSGIKRVGGIIGHVCSYENEIGYEFLYNCYSIGLISGTTYRDTLAGYADYLTYNYMYTIKSIYDQVGDGSWNNTTGTNWEALTDSSAKTNMLTNLLNEQGAGKWTRDTTGKINNGYPYLVNNIPE